MGEYGIFGLIHLAIVIYALIQIFGSVATPLGKILWTLVVAAFPLVGVIIWFFFGPGTPKR
jgi:hypothetical protein